MAQATISARVDSSDKTAFDPFYSESNMANPIAMVAIIANTNAFFVILILQNSY